MSVMLFNKAVKIAKLVMMIRYKIKSERGVMVVNSPERE